MTDFYPDQPWGVRLWRWRTEVVHWSQQDLVDRIVNDAYKNKEDRGAGVDTRLISKWENGDVQRPQAVYQRILRRLGAPLPSAQVRSASSSPWKSSPETLPGAICSAGTDGEAHQAHQREEDEGEVYRREVMRLVRGAMAGGFLSSVEPLRRRVDTALALPTDECDADEWDRVADEYAHLVGRLPAAEIFPQLLADLDEVRFRMESSPEDLRTRLVRVGGLLSGLAAISFASLGYPMEGSRYWRTAQRAAEVVGDRQFNSLVRGRRAVFALYAPVRSRTIVKLADEAIAISDGAPSAGAAAAHAARAQLFALQGDCSGARAALADLEAVFARLPVQVLSDRESQWGWSEQRLRHTQSFVHSYTGRVAEATAAQEAALALYPSSSYQGPAQVHLHRATCLIITGDPAEGVRHMIRTIEGLPVNLSRDNLVRRSAALVLEALPAQAAKLPVVSQARELLAVPTGATDDV